MTIDLKPGIADPVALGAPFEGGFFAGISLQDGRPYALVVAPKAEGEPAKPAGAAEATQAAAEPLPTNFEQYMVRWRGLLAKATSPTAVKNLYGAERALRNDCKITNDELEEVQGVRDQRVAELQK